MLNVLSSLVNLLAAMEVSGMTRFVHAMQRRSCGD